MSKDNAITGAPLRSRSRSFGHVAVAAMSEYQAITVSASFMSGEVAFGPQVFGPKETLQVVQEKIASALSKRPAAVKLLHQDDHVDLQAPLEVLGSTGKVVFVVSIISTQGVGENGMKALLECPYAHCSPNHKS